MLALKQGSVPDVIANKLDHLLILTSGTEQYLITCTNKKYKFLLTTTLTISDYNIICSGCYRIEYKILYNANTRLSVSIKIDVHIRYFYLGFNSINAENRIIV